jgi:RND family efflux transporter MFP subunit
MTRQFHAASLSAVIVAVLGFAGGGCSHPAVESVDTAESVPVAVIAARMEGLKSTILATGTVAPAPGADLTITAPESGRIAELPKNEGEVVKDGDLLVRFEIPSVVSELATRDSEIAQAIARAETAKAALARVTGLADRGIAPRRDVEEAKLAEAEADGSLKQAQAARAAAAILADRATIKARFSGVVVKRWHNVGDFVDGTATDPVLRIIDPARIEIVASVPVADLGRVYPGRPAHVLNPASGANEDASVLTQPVNVDTNSSTADIRLRLAAPTQMAVGTPVRVEIIADERPSALIIPAGAVVRDGGEVFVMVAGADNKAHKQPVTLGLSSRESVEVLTGLKTGDLVIIRGQAGLPDGAAITVAK